jgi:hypothetical protein
MTTACNSADKKNAVSSLPIKSAVLPTRLTFWCQEYNISSFTILKIYIEVTQGKNKHDGKIGLAA